MTPTEFDAYLERLVSALEAMSGPSEFVQWVAALLPAATIITAAFGLRLAWKNLGLQREAFTENLKQTQKADDRNAWWVRTEWALGRLRSTDEAESEAGKKMLRILINSDLTDQQDRKLLGSVMPPEGESPPTSALERLKQLAGPYQGEATD